MRLGPITGATLVVRHLQLSIAAFVDLLDLEVVERGLLARQRALDMGDASLASAPYARLSSHAGADSWLTLIEMPDAPMNAPHARRGWLALVLAVADLDALATRIDRRAWQVLGEPADRVGTSTTRSLQLAGTNAEVLHLVQRPAPVPAAVVPVSAADSKLQGVVLGAADCAVALGFYEGLGLLNSWRMQTAVPALALASTPAAAGQLAGGQAIDIQQLPALPANTSALRTGLRLISFARSDRRGSRLVARDDPSARILAGPEGEGIELV